MNKSESPKFYTLDKRCQKSEPPFAGSFLLKAGGQGDATIKISNKGEFHFYKVTARSFDGEGKAMDDYLVEIKKYDPTGGIALLCPNPIHICCLANVTFPIPLPLSRGTLLTVRFVSLRGQDQYIYFNILGKEVKRLTS
jgi:hypothetical protein